jgi:hypothetical protein
VLRFHMHGGKMAIAPVLHAMPAPGRAMQMVALHMDPEAHVNICAWCTREFPGLLRCSTCRQTYYCSKACITAHWPTHRAGCLAVRSAQAAQSGSGGELEADGAEVVAHAEGHS